MFLLQNNGIQTRISFALILPAERISDGIYSKSQSPFPPYVTMNLLTEGRRPSIFKVEKLDQSLFIVLNSV